LTENARLREEVEHLTRHDLTNPLMVILNIPTLLMRRPGISEDAERGIDRSPYLPVGGHPLP
jgi:hypothetical protein